jgi:hypothetical protein
LDLLSVSQASGQKYEGQKIIHQMLIDSACLVEISVAVLQLQMWQPTNNL